MMTSVEETGLSSTVPRVGQNTEGNGNTENQNSIVNFVQAEPQPEGQAGVIATTEPTSRSPPPPPMDWSFQGILKTLGRIFTGYDVIFSMPKAKDFDIKLWLSRIKKRDEEGVEAPFENLEEEITENSNNVGSKEETVWPYRIPFHFPIFTILVSLLEWVAFQYIMTADLRTILEYHPFRRFQIWRFYTDMFVHGNLRHLWSNLKVQLIIGTLLEIVHGWKRVGFLYIIGVVFGNLCVSVFSPMLACFGASGANFALITGHLASFALNWNEMSNPLVRTALMLAYLGLQIYGTVFLSIPQKSYPSHHYEVAHGAHFGGALAGFVIGVNILKNFRRRKRDIKLGRICHQIATIFFFGCIGANIAMQLFLEGFYTYKITRNGVMTYELCKSIGYLPNNTTFNYRPQFNVHSG